MGRALHVITMVCLFLKTTVQIRISCIEKQLDGLFTACFLVPYKTYRYMHVRVNAMNIFIMIANVFCTPENISENIELWRFLIIVTVSTNST